MPVGVLLPKIIFVAGVHGVGKSHLCAEICTAFNAQHLSAGDLIRQLRREETTIDKKVRDVVENQDLLLRALNKYLVTSELRVLDGHFCLLEANNRVRKIPRTVFEQIGPAGVVLLTDDVIDIQQRIRNRDQVMYEVALLAELQRQELEHGVEVCSQCNIPILVRNPHVSIERTQILEFVRELLK